MYAFLWIFTKKYDCWFIGYTYVYLQQILLNSFLKWLDQFIFPLAECEHSCCSTSSPTLGVLLLSNFSHAGGYMVVL